MNSPSSPRKIGHDDKGQMPFSLIAVLLIIASSLSVAALGDVLEKSEGIELSIEEMENMVDLSQESRCHLDQMAVQAMLGCCEGRSSNESAMVSDFEDCLALSVSQTYPLDQGGYRVEVDVDQVRLSFLRLPLYDEVDGEDARSRTYVPAYLGPTGSYQVMVLCENGRLTRNYTVSEDVRVPWPLLRGRMEAFSSSISDGMGELSSLTRTMFDSLVLYRTLQGWGGLSSPPEQGLDESLTEQDVLNALCLGTIALQYKVFRNATPCLGMCTEHLGPQQCWDLVSSHLKVGGDLDLVDIFLRLYGYEHMDWRAIFGQVLCADHERIILRWMEHLHMIDLVNMAEEVMEGVAFTLNDIIECVSGNDLMEEQFKDWLMDRFKAAGLCDTLYRYLCAGHPERSMCVPEHTLSLVNAEGESVNLPVYGKVCLDFPTVDVLDWDGWGDFREQYRRGVHEISLSMHRSLLTMAESISRSMFVPVQPLTLDPGDGITFLEEVRDALRMALEHKEEWVRPAISAAENQVSTVDPLAEATRSLFLEKKDVVLERQRSIEEVQRSVADQILATVSASYPELSPPWEENLILIQEEMVAGTGWSMMQEIVNTYEYHSSTLTEHFLEGLAYCPSVPGHGLSFLADLVARTGDPLIGLGAIISDDVDALLKEVANGLALRGDLGTVHLPEEGHFKVIDEKGREYRECLNVQVDYPKVDDLHLLIIPPNEYMGEEGRYPQLHDTDLLDMKWASFQSVWRVLMNGEIGVLLSPGGEAGNIIPMEMEEAVPLRTSHTVVTVTPGPLLDVNYRNVNTISDTLVKALEGVLRPLQEGLGWISSGVQGLYRTLVNAVKGLLEMGNQVLDLMSKLIQELLVKVQQFVRGTVMAVAGAVEAVADVIGPRYYRFSLFGLTVTLMIHPKELVLPGVGVPAALTMDLGANGCHISITTRLTKVHDGHGLLTNATLCGDDWSVYLVLDPFMDTFQHMVELRGMVDGACIELVMPELVCYQKISFSLSDIPGVGELLSSIPIPLPGVKGSLDAGIYVKLLTARTDTVVINEYELNPAGEDAGNEWIELYNPTSEAVSLVGWTVRTTHGTEALVPIGSAVLMPKERLVYHFLHQALDNQGNGFPEQESIVLCDSDGRRVDSTPFSTDHWNDGRTWQRAQDGADRWEFRSGTKGYGNGIDPFTLIDLSPFQEAFVAAVTESLYQLSSGPFTLQTLSDTLSSTILHLIHRLASDVLGREVEVGVFLEVAANDYTSAIRTGLRVELCLQCGTLGEMLDTLTGLSGSLVQGFINPFQVTNSVPLSKDDLWVGASAFGGIGLPSMVSMPGTDLEVQYVSSMEANLALLSTLFGEKGAGWGLRAGAGICGVPSQVLSLPRMPAGNLVDIWLCKASVHEAGGW
jgi:hypothetical protein